MLKNAAIICLALTASFAVNAMEKSLSQSEERSQTLFLEGLKLESAGNIEEAIVKYKLSARSGHGGAQYTLALLYKEKSDECMSNLAKEAYLDEALLWCLKTAQQVDEIALRALTESHPKQPARSDKEVLFNKALAMSTKLGEQGLEKDGVADIIKSLEAIIEASAGGGRTGQSQRKENNLGRSLRPHLKAAQKGDPEAQFTVAVVCQLQSNSAPSPELKEAYLSKAITWYRAAARKEHAKAQNNLGFICEEKAAATSDLQQKEALLDESLEWYIKAAQQGDPRVQCCAGTRCIEKRERVSGSVEKEALAEKALTLFSAAAVQGEPAALYNLGVLYLLKSEITLDPQQKQEYLNQAQEWGEKAALKSDSLDICEALPANNLGAVFKEKTRNASTGKQKRAFLKQSAMWYHEAAVRGENEAESQAEEADKQREAALRCVACGEDAKLSCGACRSVRYCNRTCQKNHWPKHKKECKKP